LFVGWVICNSKHRESSGNSEGGSDERRRRKKRRRRRRRSNSLIFAQAVAKDKREKSAIQKGAQSHPRWTTVRGVWYIIKGADCLNGFQF